MPDKNGMTIAITEYGCISAGMFESFSKVIAAADESALEVLLASEHIDVLLALYTKGHEAVLGTALKAAEKTAVSVLMLFDGPVSAAVLAKCAAAGIITGHSSHIGLMLPAAVAARRRLMAFESRTDSLQRKLDDTKLINRAKLLLMGRLSMSEQEAHRYIEKTAMDTSKKRREVAESIIRIYED